jgi:hypothetical protein
LPLKQLGDYLLLGMAFLTMLRITFRRRGEFYLTSLDYLLLGVSLFLAVMVPQISGEIVLTGVLVRGIVFYSALKLVAIQGKQDARRIAFAILSAMLVMVVVGYLR